MMDELGLVLTSLADDGQPIQLKFVSRRFQFSEKMANDEHIMMMSYSTDPPLAMEFEAQVYQANELIQSDDHLADQDAPAGKELQIRCPAVAPGEPRTNWSNKKDCSR